MMIEVASLMLIIIYYNFVFLSSLDRDFHKKSFVISKFKK